jgi:hypothetical protein
MYRQHLVIFCNDTTEALTAAASLPPYKDFPRFFILNSEKPKASDMTWLRPVDDYLSLGKVNELGNAAEIGIRAGLLYIAGWWQLFFCHANNLPSLEEVENIRKSLDNNKGFVQLDKIWGVSKEHVLLFGLGKVLSSGIAQVEEDNIGFELELVKALRGEPVRRDVLISAFLETVPTNGMEIQGELTELNQEAQNFVNFMIKQYPSISSNPGVIFISSNTSEQGLKHLLSNIDSQTMVAVVSDSELNYPIQEAISFICEDKFYIKLYTKQSSK